jgi:hypothetical protein
LRLCVIKKQGIFATEITEDTEQLVLLLYTKQKYNSVPL